ncbi:MAG: acetylglucosamine-6-sulfatase [Verrucomicrobia bacterium]|nr:acetylglucosamine-6-sulfatase [Verrucomicrobiota bacterium]
MKRMNAAGMAALWVSLCTAVGSAQVPATTTTDRLNEAWWKTRHEAKYAEVVKGGYDLVFLGDSITQGWEGSGKTTWAKYYAHRKALNIGYSGDRTEHVLWRLENGEIEGLSPKLVVIMLGTNNTGHRKDPPEQTAAGMRMILDLLKEKMPTAKFLLLAVFPREEKPDGALRRINDGVNAIYKTLADGDRVTYMDINAGMLDPDGTLTREIMPDLLHPKEKGYGIWAAAMEPFIAKTLGDTPVAP